MHSKHASVDSRAVEWRTPRRQRWASLAGGVMAAGLITGSAWPILCVVAVLLLEAQGLAPSWPEPRILLLGGAASTLLVFLVTLALITRNLFHRLSIESRWLRLHAPLRTLRVPLADLQAIRLGGFDGAADGWMSLKVRQLNLVFACRGDKTIWLEPEDAEEVLECFSGGEPAEWLPEDETTGGRVMRGLEQVTLSPYEAVQSVIISCGLGYVAGIKAREAIGGEVASGLTAAGVLAFWGFILRARWGDGQGGVARLRVALEVLALVVGAGLGAAAAR